MCAEEHVIWPGWIWPTVCATWLFIWWEQCSEWSREISTVKVQIASSAWCSILWSVHCFYTLARISFFLYPLQFLLQFLLWLHHLTAAATLSLSLLLSVVMYTLLSVGHMAVVIGSRPRGCMWWKFLARNWQTMNLLYVTLQSKGKNTCIHTDRQTHSKLFESCLVMLVLIW